MYWALAGPHFDIAMFTTFLSCFTRLSTKASGAAKLFNAVHKAQRFLEENLSAFENAGREQGAGAHTNPSNAGSSICGLPIRRQRRSSMTFPLRLMQERSSAFTGPVACGKSTLGKVFLCEYPYEGSIRFDDVELADMEPSGGQR